MRLQGAVFDGTEALLGTAGVPLPGVKEFLSLMKIEDVWMYLICDGAAAPVRTALEQSGLWNYFRGLLSAEEQGRAPLDPELYEKAVRRLRTARRATVLFTAREAALRAAGMDPGLRAEQLTLEQFAALADRVTEGAGKSAPEEVPGA